jgi:hypothetical protein
MGGGFVLTISRRGASFRTRQVASYKSFSSRLPDDPRRPDELSSVPGDAGRMTTQLGTQRGRYNEYSSKFSLSKKPMFVSPGKSQT